MDEPLDDTSLYVVVQNSSVVTRWFPVSGLPLTKKSQWQMSLGVNNVWPTYTHVMYVQQRNTNQYQYQQDGLLY